MSEIIAPQSVVLPWQIYSGNIPANDEHRVILADWFFWEDNRETQKVRILAEKPGGLAQGNRILLSQIDTKLCVVVRSPGLKEQKAWCRLWINRQTRRLVLEKTNVY